MSLPLLCSSVFNGCSRAAAAAADLWMPVVSIFGARWILGREVVIAGVFVFVFVFTQRRRRAYDRGPGQRKVGARWRHIVCIWEGRCCWEGNWKAKMKYS